jgi:uncharacterized protein YebE (UPF0316 family)
MDADVVLGALLIFSLRVLGISISTVRVLLMTRGTKLASAALGFFEVLVYAVAIGKVVQDLSNLPYLFSYCFGFSVGTLLGMWIEERMAIGYATIHVISHDHGHEIAEALREAGYGATESQAHGKDGYVAAVQTVVRRRDIVDASAVIHQTAPDAFVTIEEARRVEHGYLRTGRQAR